jgi:hypothetical protein
VGRGILGSYPIVDGIMSGKRVEERFQQRLYLENGIQSRTKALTSMKLATWNAVDDAGEIRNTQTVVTGRRGQ